jgi:hypothetical protein
MTQTNHQPPEPPEPPFNQLQPTPADNTKSHNVKDLTNIPQGSRVEQYSPEDLPEDLPEVPKYSKPIRYNNKDLRANIFIGGKLCHT